MCFLEKQVIATAEIRGVCIEHCPVLWYPELSQLSWYTVCARENAFPPTQSVLGFPPSREKPGYPVHDGICLNRWSIDSSFLLVYMQPVCLGRMETKPSSQLSCGPSLGFLIQWEPSLLDVGGCLVLN